MDLLVTDVRTLNLPLEEQIYSSKAQEIIFYMAEDANVPSNIRKIFKKNLEWVYILSRNISLSKAQNANL